MGVIIHNGALATEYIKAVITDATKASNTLSVYRNLRLNPPLTTQKMNNAVDSKKVDKKMIIMFMIINKLISTPFKDDAWQKHKKHNSRDFISSVPNCRNPGAFQ